jgi:hypothetical protein
MAKDVKVAYKLIEKARLNTSITPALKSYLAGALATLGESADHTSLYEMINPTHKPLK